MVGDTVLTAFVGVIPIEGDDITGIRGVGVVLPLVTIFEPILTRVADGKTGKNAVFKKATLVGALTDKDGTPAYSLIEAVPTAVGVTTRIIVKRQPLQEIALFHLENGCRQDYIRRNVVILGIQIVQHLEIKAQRNGGMGLGRKKTIIEAATVAQTVSHGIEC